MKGIKYNELSYLFGYYIPNNQNNKFLKMKTSSKNKTYFCSPNSLLLSSDLPTTITNVKEQANKSKVIYCLFI